MNTDATKIAAPLISYRDRVKPEWIDSNDHLNTMHYKTIADWGTRTLFALAGWDAHYRESNRKTIFQLEMHIAYERELRLDQPFEVRSWLIAADAKRLHHFHEIVQTADHYRAATVELMSMHIDDATRRSVPFSPELQQGFQKILAVHSAAKPPSNVSRRIGMAQQGPHRGA